DNPRNVVTVFIPEYVVGHWWEQILHNQSALRIKARLLFEPGVMVTSVPWQARSSTRVAQREELAPGAVRWGMNSDRAAKSINSTPGNSSPGGGPPAGAAEATPPTRGVDRP
ncbi:MAG: DNA-binding protein, partial [Pseudonocardiaceae bacterium]